MTLPTTAFEQAAIVAIFAVLLSAMGYIFYRILASLMKDFQNFISLRDAQWQSYFVQREEEFGERNTMVVDSIKALTSELRALKELNEEHIGETRHAIATMEERTRPLHRQPQKKAGQ